MSLISLKRKLSIAHNIDRLLAYNKTILNDDYCIAKINYNDIWLRLASLNTAKLHNVISLAILLIMVQDKSILISGKKVKSLVNFIWHK